MYGHLASCASMRDGIFFFSVGPFPSVCFFCCILQVILCRSAGLQFFFLSLFFFCGWRFDHEFGRGGLPVSIQFGNHRTAPPVCLYGIHLGTTKDIARDGAIPKRGLRCLSRFTRCSPACLRLWQLVGCSPSGQPADGGGPARRAGPESGERVGAAVPSSSCAACLPLACALRKLCHGSIALMHTAWHFVGLGRRRARERKGVYGGWPRLPPRPRRPSSSETEMREGDSGMWGVWVDVCRHRHKGSSLERLLAGTVKVPVFSFFVHRVESLSGFSRGSRDRSTTSRRGTVPTGTRRTLHDYC
ncbi:uncharacterized protein BKA78DRAFT_82996 [Phyllosticta capitalensis]|uniref:uncharacterized protein n=1 Tax=Phyllosticta capitalensis TaxID=121624 RepID=UPI00312EC781